VEKIKWQTLDVNLEGLTQNASVIMIMGSSG
jgi:hypothetical protein